MSNLYDLVIIGAGVSGLTCALKTSELAQQNNLPQPKILILEGAETIGGRTVSSQLDNGTIVDLGAHWFHGGQANPFYQWVTKKYPQIEFGEDQISTRIVIDPQGNVGGEFYKTGSQKIEDAFEAFKKENPDKDISLHELAAQMNDPAIGIVVEYITRNWLAHDDANDISCCELFEDGVAAGGMQTVKGIETVIQHMVAELKQHGVTIQTGQIVKEIYQKGDRASIHTTDGKRYVADDVVLTVPVKIIQEGKIKFFPEMDESIETYIDKITMGKMTKIIVPLTNGFFDERKIADNTFVSRFDTDKPLLCHLRTGGKPVVTILIGGDLAGDIEAYSQDRLDAYTASVLEAIDVTRGYHRHLSGDVVKTGWNSNPLTQGAYANIMPGTKRRDSARDNNIIYSGTSFASSGNHAECMAGAWYAGGTAANDVIEESVAEMNAMFAPKNL